MRSALLIIDMQNGCIAPKKVYPDLEKVVSKINLLRQIYRENNLPVIYPVIEHASDGSTLPRETKSVWNVKGTTEARIIDQLAPASVDHVIAKTRLSSFYKTNLNELLKHLNIGVVVLTGFQLSVCVLATGIDAYQLGYYQCVVRDAVLDINEERFKNFSKYFSDLEYLISTEELQSEVQAGWPRFKK